MNVWIVNPFDNLPLEGNRPQRYWLRTRAFARAGHRVTLWTSDFSHARKTRRKVKVEGQEWTDSSFVVESEGIEVRMVPTRPYPANVCLARIRSHRQLARDFEEDAKRQLLTLTSPLDLVVASTPPLGLCAAAMRVARSCGAKFVCDIQDAWSETFARLLPRGFKWMGRFLLASMHKTARLLYREADLVTGVCSRYAGLSGRKDFYLAYHGIEHASVKMEREKLRNVSTLCPLPSTLSPNIHRLVYIGNLGAGYDLATVIDAVAQRPELTLDIAGKGPTEDSLRFKVKSSKLESRVRFHGYLGAEELSDLMARCDVGVIPMRDDSWVGLPNKLTDYLNAGLHVVSSLHGECGALLERTGFGRTYDRGNVGSLLAALDGLPGGSVSLPDELRGESIYPKYVERVCVMHHPAR